MKHIDEIELEQMLDGTLPLLRKPFVKLHLGSCEECRKKLEEMREGQEAFQLVAAQMRRLDEADRQSAKYTRQTVTSIYSPSKMKNDD